MHPETKKTNFYAKIQITSTYAIDDSEHSKELSGSIVHGNNTFLMHMCNVFHLRAFWENWVRKIIENLDFFVLW